MSSYKKTGPRIANVESYKIPQLQKDWQVEEEGGNFYLCQPNKKERFMCNLSGGLVCAALDGRRTIADVALILGKHVKQDALSILPDIVDTLHSLSRRKLVEFKHDVGIEQREKLFDHLPVRYSNVSHLNPFSFFDAIFCINVTSDTQRWSDIQIRFQKLGIADRVIHFPAVETPISHHIGCTLTHRHLIALAKHHQFDNILVFEDDALMLENVNELLPLSTQELNETDWKLFYLGGCLRYNVDRDIPDKQHLKFAKALTCTHAIAYHHRVYEKILMDIPDNLIDMDPWMRAHAAIDQYLTAQIPDGYLAYPTLSAQPQTLQWENPTLQPFYK